MTLFMRILECDLPAWLANGWTVAARDWSPSAGVVFLMERCVSAE